ncbi:MAG TPA: hypothetical protein VF461_18590, partial [Gemmatimonadaceae bacterium]
TLQVVWRQWQALGAEAPSRSVQSRRPLQALIDPEALLLVSLVLMSDECGLAELLYDWGAKNSALLSVQRTRKLATAYPARARRHLMNQLTGFAIVARDKGNDARWRSVAEQGEHGDCRLPDELARKSHVANWSKRHGEASDRSGAHATMVGQDAPGVVPGTSRLTRVCLVEDAALILRLRQAFGVCVKADVLAYLLARVDEAAALREISDAVTCSPATAYAAAEELSAARLVRSLDGQPPSFRATHESWNPLLGFEDRPPRWAGWSRRYVLLTALLHWADTTSRWPVKSSASAARDRDLVERYRSSFVPAPAVVSIASSQREDWRGILRRAMHDLTGWMNEMA